MRGDRLEYNRGNESEHRVRRRYCRIPVIFHRVICPLHGSQRLSENVHASEVAPLPHPEKFDHGVKVRTIDRPQARGYISAQWMVVNNPLPMGENW